LGEIDQIIKQRGQVPAPQVPSSYNWNAASTAAPKFNIAGLGTVATLALIGGLGYMLLKK
jgi:hypothetical protein